MMKDIKSVGLETRKRRSRRKESADSDSFSIEEIFPDEMGYEADVEVIRPNQYEDAESDSESDINHSSQVKCRSIDEELAERMYRLGREHATTVPQSRFIDRGRKRTSWELDNDGSMLQAPMSPDFEVQEMVDHIDQPSAAKRRKKRSKRSGDTHYLLRNQGDMWTDSSERTGTRRHDEGDDSVSTHASEEVRKENGEAMDMT